MANDTVVMEVNGVSLGPDYPLYQLTHESVGRVGEQGYAMRKCHVMLEGFVTGDSNTDIQGRYLTLAGYFKNNDVLFTYTVSDGVTTRVLHNSRRLYVEVFDEPTEWKQYDGAWRVQLYYFEPETNAGSNLQVAASLGAYTWGTTVNPVPAWKRTTELLLADFNDYVIPIGYTGKGTKVNITLNGFLSADAGAANPVTQLKSRMDSLETAVLSNNGIHVLSYCGFSATVRSMRLDWSEELPHDHIGYTLQFQYCTAAIFNLKCQRNITRINWSPVIKPKPLCSEYQIQSMLRSTQTVTYNLSCQADSISNARAQLQTEALARITPGGIEMPGGVENEDENSNTVSVSIPRLYVTPIYQNIAGEGTVINGRP